MERKERFSFIPLVFVVVVFVLFFLLKKASNVGRVLKAEIFQQKKKVNAEKGVGWA